MGPSKLVGDVYVDGTLIAKTLVPSAGCLENSHVSANAGLDPAKMKRRFRAGYAKESPAAETIALHVVRSTTTDGGTVISFVAGCRVAPTGDYTITVDLQNGGVSVLSAVITLSSASTARLVQVGTITSDTLDEDDWLDIVIAVAGSSGAQGSGLFVCCEIEEAML